MLPLQYLQVGQISQGESLREISASSLEFPHLEKKQVAVFHCEENERVSVLYVIGVDIDSAIWTSINADKTRRCEL